MNSTEFIEKSKEIIDFLVKNKILVEKNVSLWRKGKVLLRLLLGINAFDEQIEQLKIYKARLKRATDEEILEISKYLLWEVKIDSKESAKNPRIILANSLGLIFSIKDVIENAKTLFKVSYDKKPSSTSDNGSKKRKG